MVQGNAVNGNRAAASWVERNCGEVRKPKIVFHFGDDLSGADFGKIFDLGKLVFHIARVMAPTVLIAGNFRLDFLHHAVYFCKDGIDAEFGYGQRDEAVDEPIAEGGILEQVSDGNRVFDAVRVLVAVESKVYSNMFMDAYLSSA